MLIDQHIRHIRYLRIVPDNENRIKSIILHQQNLFACLGIGKVKLLPQTVRQETLLLLDIFFDPR